MARPDGGMGGIVKIALIGGAGWFGYNYLVNSGLWGQWFGGAAASSALPAGSTGSIVSGDGSGSSSAPPASSSAPPPPPAPAPLVPVSRAALIAAAGGPGVTENVDQWVYYYSQVSGVPVTGGQVNTMLGATNQSATNRDARLTVDQFLAVLPVAGLSGFGAAPRRLVPITARAAWGARTPARALPPNYVRRGAPMNRRR
jgi:hypothetical protein